MANLTCGSCRRPTAGTTSFGGFCIPCLERLLAAVREGRS